MRPQQKKFVVEVKSSRRLKSKGPKSIWGTADLEIMARELSSPERPSVHEHSEAKISPKPDVAAIDERQAAALDAASTQQLAEVRPGYAEDGVNACETHLSQNSPTPQPVLTNSEDGTSEPDEPSDDLPTAVKATKPIARKRSDRRASSLDTGWDGPKTSGSAGPAAVIFEDVLLRLEDENRSLKRQLREKLRADNELLRAMLGRF